MPYVLMSQALKCVEARCPFCQAMPNDPVGWRRLWRARGLALDRLLPLVFGHPAVPLRHLPKRVERGIVVPGDGRYDLCAADASLVADAGVYVARFIAEQLPVQVVATDMKPQLPSSSSTLAVRKVGSETEFLGSFDLLLRVFGRTAPWKDYVGEEVVVDIKLCGCSGRLGLNGPTMRTYLAHARLVLKAARQEGTRVGGCRAVAFLLRRPPGRTFEGGEHAGSFGFVAVDAGVLLAWDPAAAARAPATLVMSGALLQRGSVAEPSALPFAAPSGPQRRCARDRWVELDALCVKTGWVAVKDFCKLFEIGSGNNKKGTERALKRLRDDAAEVSSWKQDGRGAPFKIARVSALQQCYPEKKR